MLEQMLVVQSKNRVLDEVVGRFASTERPNLNNKYYPNSPIPIYRTKKKMELRGGQVRRNTLSFRIKSGSNLIIMNVQTSAMYNIMIVEVM